MNSYVVPQFIDVEDKIFGPITVRQFIIMTIGGLFIFIAFKLSDFSLFIFEAIIILIVTISISFVKINGKLFHYFLIDFFNFLFKIPKFAVWQKKEITKIEKKEKKEKKDDYVALSKTLSRTRLAELSLIVDTGGSYVGETVFNPIVDNQSNNLSEDINSDLE